VAEAGADHRRGAHLLRGRRLARRPITPSDYLSVAGDHAIGERARHRAHSAAGRRPSVSPRPRASSSPRRQAIGTRQSSPHRRRGPCRDRLAPKGSAVMAPDLRRGRDVRRGP
jgi:hypothetical protein